MEMSSFIDTKISAYLELQEPNVIITWGGWFTEGHIEIGGYESVAHVPIGEKILLIAKRGAASRFLSNQTRCGKKFMDFVVRGPPERYNLEIFYYIFDAKVFQ